jgi:hypothetical protein
MLNWRLTTGLSLFACCATVQAASVMVPLAATIVAVQCTSEQRARIRACVTPEQQTSVGPYKSMVTIESGVREHEVLGRRHEILVDPSRQVIVRTLLY